MTQGNAPGAVDRPGRIEVGRGASLRRLRGVGDRPAIDMDDEVTRPMFLETSSEAIFAVLHEARSARPGATGVVICPLFGWEDLCTHRARRAWASALADSGYPTVRLDLPGTGDSGGTPWTDGQLDGWIEALGSAAGWLREEQRCSRICCVGIGFGGMLAWLTAAGGGCIDDFIFWAVPMKGRRVAREVRAAAMLSIDRQIDLELVPERQLPWLDERGVLLDEAGQVTAEETVASLGKLDLAKVPLPDPHRRRILVLQRDRAPDDETLIGHARSLGADVTAVPDANGYGDLMRYVQESVVPREVIDRSIAWLATPAMGGESVCRGSATAARAVSSVEMFEDGVAIRETAVTYDLPSGRLCGVLTEPVDALPAGVCAAFFSGGSDRRIGPNRMWVTLARRWAAKGVASVRLDPPGVGDAAGDERAWDHVRRHYQRHHADLVVELLDELPRRGLPDRFVLVGFCSGAHRAVQAADGHPRVAAVFGVGLMLFRWTWWTHNVHDSWLPAWSPGPGDAPLKIRLAALLKLAVGLGQSLERRYIRIMQVRPSGGERMLRRLSGQGTKVLLLLKRRSYAYQELMAPSRRDRLRRLPGVEIRGLAGADQRFRPLILQHMVEEAMDEALAPLIEPTDECRPTTEAAAGLDR